MAKQLVGNGANSYTFDASAQTVLISGIDSLEVGQILLINNATRETIIYNPFVSGRGYSAFSNGLLTLEYDTTAMADGDVLQIFYDNSDQALVAVTDLALEIKSLVNQIATPMWADAQGLKVGSGTITTVATVTTVTTVTSLNTLNSMPIPLALTDHLMQMAYLNLRDRIT